MNSISGKMEQNQKAKSNTKPVRLIVQESSSFDLSDLLYYDSIIPVESSSDFMSITDELQHDEFQQKLIKADLISSRERFLSKEDIRKLDERMLLAESFGRGSLFSSQGYIDKIRKGRAKVELLRDSAILANNHGIKVVCKLNTQQFSLIIDSPKDFLVLGLLYCQIPLIDLPKTNIEKLIACLIDERVQGFRREIFSWQNDLEKQLEQREMRVKPAPELYTYCIDDYVTLLEARGVKLSEEYSEKYIMISWVKNIDNLEGLIFVDFENDGSQFDFLRPPLVLAKAQIGTEKEPACIIYSPNTEHIRTQ